MNIGTIYGAASEAGKQGELCPGGKNSAALPIAAAPPEMLPTSANARPGPWFIDGLFDAEVSVQIRAGDPDGESVLICEIEPFLEDWTDEEIANVHLLAAAPDLLKALKAFTALPATQIAPVLWDIQAAVHAIAKAEGRSK